MSDSPQTDPPAAGLVALLLSLVIAGCGESTIPHREAEAYVASWADRIGRVLRERASKTTAQSIFERELSERADDQRESVSRDEPPYLALADDAYGRIDHELRLTDRDGLSKRGKQAFDRLDAVDEHAISRKHFEFEKLSELRTRLQSLAERIESKSAFDLRKKEKRAAIAIVGRQKVGEFALSKESDGRLARTFAEHRRGKRFRARVQSLRPVVEEHARVRAKLERVLAENVLRYSRRMKHFQLRDLYVSPRPDDYWTNPNIEGDRPDEEKGPFVAETLRKQAVQVADAVAEPVAILHDRMTDTLHEVLTSEAPGKVLDELAPSHPQYAKLKKEYERYREIVRNGGWDKVAPDWDLTPGETSSTVRELKLRLRAEGYFPKDAAADEHYGETLEKAVEAYQRTHQMKVNGRPHATFWSSVNKPARERLNQIGLNLQRWRASEVRHEDPLYVRVNLPGFHLEVWKDQQLAMRFPVVIGDDELKVNKNVEKKEKKKKKKEEKENPNHSPTFSAYIDRVVYNPYWNVTDRIRNEEILPKVRRSLEKTYTDKLRRLKYAVQQREEKTETNEKKKREPPTEGNRQSASEGGGETAGLAPDRALASAGIGPAEAEAGAPGGDGTGAEAGGGGDSEQQSATTSDEEPSAANSSDSGAASAENNGKSKDAKPAWKKVEIEEFIAKRIDSSETKKIFKDQIVFDVAAIEKLLERAPAEVRATNAEFCPGAERKTAATTGGAKASGGSEADGKCEEGPSTSLGRVFPYLQRKSGKVDVSTTDPDNIPEWYAKNRYEVKFPGQEWEYVRELQGEKNSLGRVKVIFPNPYAVYLHDTPKTHLFSRTIRAFSHGCMRMEKPLRLAEFLLRQQGLYEKYDVQKLLEGEEHEIEADNLKKARKKPGVIETNEEGKKVRMTYEYKPIFLKRHIPVHVEYFTVRVDENGRANFFLDVYDRDEKKLKKRDYIAGLKSSN
ncbi:MAG: L,D-transpeptidase family protein [Bradymonadaceae bacterium]